MTAVVIELPGIPLQGITSVSTATALRALSSSGRSEGDNIVVDGGVASGDGAGGTFVWVGASLADDDGATAIKPTDKSALQAGRWIALEAAALQDVLRRGIVIPKNLGTADDGPNINSELAAAAGKVVMLLYRAGGYRIETPLVLPANTTLVGQSGVRLYSQTAGRHIVSATGVSNIRIEGIAFEGADDATVPASSFGGHAAANSGLVTISNCTDVRVLGCEFKEFYNGLTVQRCTRAWIERNRVRDFRLQGILGSQSSFIWITDNVVTDCTQNGNAQAYGIHVTGDDAGGFASECVRVRGNVVRHVPSWDGFMSHDVTDLEVSGNTFENVRCGVDVGHADPGSGGAANRIRRVVIANNKITGTQTDTRGGTVANSGGILVVGYGTGAGELVEGVTITGNRVSGFFNATGMQGVAGVSSNITVRHASDANVTGNSVSGSGNAFTNAGVNLSGTCNRCVVSDNSLQGQMASGGIRVQASFVSDALSLGLNSIIQTTTSDAAVLISAGASVTSLASVSNAINSSAPFTIEAGAFVTFARSVPQGSFTGTLTGVTATTTGPVKYSVSGDSVTLEFADLTATSNSTDATITGLPASLRPVNDQVLVGLTYDNGVASVSLIKIGSGGTITLYKGVGVSSFTNSGTKGVGGCTVTYRRSA